MDFPGIPYTVITWVIPSVNPLLSLPIFLALSILLFVLKPGSPFTDERTVEIDDFIIQPSVRP